jgi:lipoic acid synthetase
MEKRTRRLPDWMKTPMPGGKQYLELKKLTLQHNLNTICSSGNCPNRSECWGAGTASFMILGNKCTRNCRFCDVPNMIPDEADWNEPKRLAKSIKTLKLKHCVITSVARDDMDDGGAAFWAKTIEVVNELNPSLTLEVLIPDFDALPEDIQKVIDAKPEVISHNLETVRRLSTKVRDRARYSRSLTVLKQVVENGIVAKSGIMLGLGETHEEILQTMDDLRKIGCKVMTLGQYLAPSEHHLKIENFVEPELFKQYKEEGLKRGFTFVESSPLVRSSYHAELHVNA